MGNTNWTATFLAAMFTFLIGGLTLWCANMWILHIGVVDKEIVLNAAQSQIPGFFQSCVIAFIINFAVGKKTLLGIWEESQSTEAAADFDINTWAALIASGLIGTGIGILVLYLIS